MTRTSLVRRATIPFIVAGLALAGCGSDNESDGTPRGDLAKAMADVIETIGGVTADTDCIESEAASLSDAQVEALTKSYEDEEAVPADSEDWTTATSEKCVSIDG